MLSLIRRFFRLLLLILGLLLIAVFVWFAGPYFAEVTVRLPDAARRHATLAERGIVAGYLPERDEPKLRDTLLLAATELTTDDDIDYTVSKFVSVVRHLRSTAPVR